MAKFGLTEGELNNLETCLLAAVAGRCIPDWEFEALLGCSHGEAGALIAAGLRRGDPDERLLDQVVMLLSALAGSAQRSVGGRSARRSRAEGESVAAGHSVDLSLLHDLLAKLMGEPAAPTDLRSRAEQPRAPKLRSRAEEPRASTGRPERPRELESSVKLRVPRPLLAKRAAKKRPA